MSETPAPSGGAIEFQTHPSQYKHLKLDVKGEFATLSIDIQEDQGLVPGYVLKLNSYDLGVDIELADAIGRLRFEHPEVKVVTVQSGQDGIFSSGANIFMLGSSTHAFKVNFCKYTNETRLYMEDASHNSGQKYLAGLNGTCSGGGYELALACDEIVLIDDRKSAVSLPEVPYLGVLPGTGGLTRVVDKRKVRRDRADVFCTLAEGLKGKRALKWGLVDTIAPSSKFGDTLKAAATKLADFEKSNRKGITLETLSPETTKTARLYDWVKLDFNKSTRIATLTVTLPENFDAPDLEDPSTLDSNFLPLQLFREIDDALLQLRFNHPQIGLVLLKTQGKHSFVEAMDNFLFEHRDHWFVNEVILLMKRVLKRYDLTAKSFFALVEPGSCFTGSILEFALGSDRIYMLEEEGLRVALSPLNNGLLPMPNGLSRLEARLYGEPELLKETLAQGPTFDSETANEFGLTTEVYDDIDWDDEIRLATEERAGLSPDALTGMEASLRFVGPETLETKIFGRLSAWQNWIFQRPNAVGPKGALTLFGQPENAEFNYDRT
ncbi:MAG: 2,3-epoxybenzoyl-CoA dihydrolase [Myxococcota bacterium]|nr:2,3-epoxybenzoyl-CoA dihydrolase [Myxococcota bacterium]